MFVTIVTVLKWLNAIVIKLSGQIGKWYCLTRLNLPHDSTLQCYAWNNVYGVRTNFTNCKSIVQA